ncbi:MAG: hypothetical protein JOZ07_16190 [Solirubrobacterales bacterium]|nr:hypothetical protein [Solirubrobacterales bacterium]
MTSPEQLAHPEQIPGYDLGRDRSARSPLTLDELAKLEAAAGLTDHDDRRLAEAGEILTPYAAEMVDAWRALLAPHPHLARYSQHPDGTADEAYAAASHPRFARWIIDVCTRPRDQAWLDYQHEIGLRHTHQKKNQTDGSDSPEHIPMRYLLAFTGPVIATTREFLARSGRPADDIDALHAAFTKAVMLNVTLWTRAYVATEDW